MFDLKTLETIEGVLKQHMKTMCVFEEQELHNALFCVQSAIFNKKEEELNPWQE